MQAPPASPQGIGSLGRCKDHASASHTSHTKSHRNSLIPKNYWQRNFSGSTQLVGYNHSQSHSSEKLEKPRADRSWFLGAKDSKFNWPVFQEELRGKAGRELFNKMQLRTGASKMVRGARISQIPRLSPILQIPLDLRLLQSTSFSSSSRRDASAFSAAVSVAGNIVSNAFTRATKGDMPSIDPLRIVAKEMKFLTGNIRKLLGSGHPSLDRAAKYYTQAEGKHVRPLIVLLMARATSLCPKEPQRQQATINASAAIDSSISPLSVLSDFNPSANSAAAVDAESTDVDILPSQRRLAEITELIHTASLLHDDVIDHSVSRRGSPSANLEFGNKMAVLAGDFLLGRASVALARLRHAEVVELLATVIANLVEGEFMQLKNTARDEKNPTWSEETLTYYLQKTYLKTASLISKSCRASALLGGADAATVDAAYAYGKNLGLAFQLVDDMLDYTRSEQELGKPAGADLELGLATAPLLFAWKIEPELGALVGRKFEREGDVARARDLVMQSNGIEQTRALAEDYAQKAIDAISAFPDSEAKDGLIEMAVKTIKRRK